MTNPKYTETGDLLVALPFAKTEVTLRRPKGRDMEAIELAARDRGTNTGVLMVALSVLSGLEADAVANLDAEDLEVLGSALEHFPLFSKGLRS